MSNALRIAHGPYGRVALLDMDAPLVRHAHPHCHVLIKAEGADTQFRVRGQMAPLTRDNAVLVNAWEPHQYEHEPGRPRTIILALYIEPHWLGQFRRNWTASGAPGFFGQTCVALPPHVRRLADRLAEALAQGQETQAAQEELLSALMIAVVERFTPWRAGGQSLRDLAGHNVVDRRIKVALHAMDANPLASTDVTALAARCGVSRAHFFRLFQRATQVPPRVFTNVLRLERAVTALVTQDTPVRGIGEELGFAAPPHFTRFFRDHAGAAPREFRACSNRL